MVVESDFSVKLSLGLGQAEQLSNEINPQPYFNQTFVFISISLF